MSRAVHTDYEFNKERFTLLLKKGQGGLSQTEYAKKCGVSVAYMCKYLNGRFDQPPTPTTLRKISEQAQNFGVTFEELLTAAGYSPTKYSFNRPVPTRNLSFDKLATATITTALSACDFSWTAINMRNSYPVDFTIELDDSPVSRWHFCFLSMPNRVLPKDSAWTERIWGYYGKLVSIPHEANTKYSFVTDSEALYLNMRRVQPYMLSIYVSTILIDPNEGYVISEEYLQSYLQPDEELKTRYILKKNRGGK